VKGRPLPIRTLLTIALAAGTAGAKDDAPQAGDLAALVECRAGGVTAYNSLATELTGSGRAAALKRLGMREVKSANPFLAEYRLAAPITVFGRTTSHVAFNSAGVLAVLDEADPHPLGAQLGVTAAVDRPGKYLAEKVVSQIEEQVSEDVKLTATTTLNVSTVDSHPGKVLAGCGYRIDTE